MRVLTVVIFLVILGVTLVITYWAARRTGVTTALAFLTINAASRELSNS